MHIPEAIQQRGSGFPSPVEVGAARDKEPSPRGLEIGAIVWGIQNVGRAVEFWSAALDYVVKYYAEDDFAILLPKEGNGVQLSITKVTSPKARRHHMDLFADNPQREVARLLALGATRKPWNYEADADYVVLNDPDGNPFCVVQK